MPLYCWDCMVVIRVWNTIVLKSFDNIKHIERFQLKLVCFTERYDLFRSCTAAIPERSSERNWGCLIALCRVCLRNFEKLACSGVSCKSTRVLSWSAGCVDSGISCWNVTHSRCYWNKRSGATYKEFKLWLNFLSPHTYTIIHQRRSTELAAIWRGIAHRPQHDKKIWVRHSGGPPFRRSAIPGYYCYNNPNLNPNPILTLTLTLTPGCPEWRTSGMAGRYR